MAPSGALLQTEPWYNMLRAETVREKVCRRHSLHHFHNVSFMVLLLWLLFNLLGLLLVITFPWL